MSFDLALRRGASSPSAKSWIVAAILLALHWAAPGALQLRAALISGDTTGGFSSTARASQPGSLPRITPRTVALEANLTKASESGWIAGGKLNALLASDRTVQRFIAPAPVTGVGDPAPRPASARGFDARAPPAVTA